MLSWIMVGSAGVANVFDQSWRLFMSV